MIEKLLKFYLWRGVFWGNTIFVINFVIVDLSDHNLMEYMLLENFIFSVMAFLVLGLGTGTATIIYEFERLSKLQQSAIHLTIGLCSYVFMQFMLFGEILTNMGVGIAYFLIIFFAVWCGFYLYERHEAKKINEKLRKRNTKE